MWEITLPPSHHSSIITYFYLFNNYFYDKNIINNTHFCTKCFILFKFLLKIPHFLYIFYNRKIYTYTSSKAKKIFLHFSATTNKFSSEKHVSLTLKKHLYKEVLFSHYIKLSKSKMYSSASAFILSMFLSSWLSYTPTT